MSEKEIAYKWYIKGFREGLYPFDSEFTDEDINEDFEAAWDEDRETKMEELK